MSGRDHGASTGGGGNWPVNKPSNDARNDLNGGGDADSFNDQGGDDFNIDGFGERGAGEGGAGGDGGVCRNCGQDGHFARNCSEPRKMGACFNCGEEGHSKVDCPQPRQFSGECRTCGEKGHPAADCPNRVIKCNICREEGHEAHQCSNAMVIDRTKIPDKTEKEAYAMLRVASDCRDLDDFKEAVDILSKACPELTYPRLEKECRKREFKIYLIAMEKDHGDTITNVNMQGEIEKKYTVGYYFNEKPQRPNLRERWPKSSEENLERLADAGVPMDRGVEKCNNCEQLGHTSRRCTEEKQEVDRPTVKCALCDQEGHRVRDCLQERRKQGPKACKVCESEEHMAKDCPNREKRTCRNCGSEDHIAKECDQPRNPATIKCRNCDEMGHASRDCTAPKDWSRVKCSNCEEMGHTKVRCKQPPKEDENAGFGGNNNKGGLGGEDAAVFGGGDAGAAISGNNNWESATPTVAVESAGGTW